MSSTLAKIGIYPTTRFVGQNAGYTLELEDGGSYTTYFIFRRSNALELHRVLYLLAEEDHTINGAEWDLSRRPNGDYELLKNGLIYESIKYRPVLKGGPASE